MHGDGAKIKTVFPPFFARLCGTRPELRFLHRSFRQEEKTIDGILGKHARSRRLIALDNEQSFPHIGNPFFPPSI